jgi:hypothetical protein
MNARERRLVRMAELASMNPDDTELLLGKVVGALGAMVRAGKLREVDQMLAGMRPSTARLVCLIALAGQKAGRPSVPPDLLARLEAEYEAALVAEDDSEDDALAHAREFRAAAERRVAERQAVRRARERDAAFIARLRRAQPEDC